MKDYYSESKIHKFIITNNTGRDITSEEFARHLFYKIIRDAKDKFLLKAGKSIQIECVNDWENYFDAYMIDNFDGAWSRGDAFMSDEISIKHCEER